MGDFKEIYIQELNKTFGKKKAVCDFNLTIKSGEFVTLLGPSGSGKSTVLNCIAGLIPITSGKIYIDDECIDDGINSVPAEKRNFGMVFQNYALFPHLNVFDNVAFGLKIRKVNKELITKKVKDVLDLVHLSEHIYEFPGQISGGEQQRVALARCIVIEPRLMLLDEPLSNLDAKLRIEMRYELKALHKRLGITTIYVTHDQQEALALSDRIVVMAEGKIQQVGAPEEIYSTPESLFVASFMGFRNIWPVQINSFRSDNEVSLRIGQLEILAKLQDKYKKSPLRAKGGNIPIFAAVRPEDIQIGDGPVNQIDVRVEVVEYLGQVKQIWATAYEETFIELSTINPLNAKPGEVIRIWIPPEKILVFSEEES